MSITSSISMPHVVLLDLDGTLLDDSQAEGAVAGTCEWLAASHPGLDAARLAAANATAWAELWPTLEADWMLGRLDSERAGLEPWRRALAVCGLEDRNLAGAVLRKFMELELSAYRLFSDVPLMLEALSNRGIRTAVVTNGAGDYQRRKLGVLGLDGLAGVAISGELGVRKPDTRIFEHVLDELEVDPSDAWHVGDTLATDVAGAVAAGITSVWVNRKARARGQGDPEPTIEVRSLLELPAHLDAAHPR